MDIFNGLKQRMGLAMAGKSPWGSGNNGANGGGDGGDGDTGGPDGGGEGGGESGPRNPWLPGGGKSSDGRRSASIEDIFKNRGPEGPNRGGGPRGPSFNFPKRSGGKSWTPWIIIGVIALAIFMTSTHLVGPKEQGVVKTLGSFTRTMNSGLNFSAPYPIEVVDIEDVQGVRALNIPGSSEGVKLILTGDQNLVDLSYIVRWNIKNLEQFKFRLVQPEETVAEVAEAAMRASIAEKELDETFSGQGRAAIEQNVRERMQEVLDSYQAGIQVLGVEIEKADPPAEVVDAFRDVQVAEQNADAARNQAQGYAQQVLAQAEGQAQAFDKVYEEYRLAPRVTRQRLYYETMERVLSQTDKTIIETEGVTPYLPLPEIRKRATAPQPITVPQAQSGGN